MILKFICYYGFTFLGNTGKDRLLSAIGSITMGGFGRQPFKLSLFYVPTHFINHSVSAVLTQRHKQ